MLIVSIIVSIFIDFKGTWCNYRISSKAIIYLVCNAINLTVNQSNNYDMTTLTDPTRFKKITGDIRSIQIDYSIGQAR